MKKIESGDGATALNVTPEPMKLIPEPTGHPEAPWPHHGPSIWPADPGLTARINALERRIETLEALLRAPDGS